MRRSVSRTTRLLTGALATVVLGALTAPPCLAAPPVAPQAPGNLRASVARLATPDASASARFTQEAGKEATGSGSRSFIHSPKGVVAVLMLVGGVAWAIASRSKDAVHSPGRN